MRYEVDIAGERRTVDLRRVDGRFVVTIGHRSWTVDASLIDRHTLSLLMSAATDADSPPALAGGMSYDVTLAPELAGGAVAVRVGTASMSAVLNGRRRARGAGAGDGLAGPQRIVAPMPGKVVRLLVTRGQSVEPRQGLVVVEAMKMENELKAGRAGRVVELPVQVGQSVDAGTLVAVIADEDRTRT